MKRFIDFISVNLKKIADYLFGYDYFISYAHADGLRYPNMLVKELELSGFTVFLDSKDYHVGDELKSATRRRVGMSKYLIVVGQKEAFVSTWVEEEIRIFKEKKRTLILININESFNRLSADNEIAKLIGDAIFIHEHQDESNPMPSLQTVDKIRSQFEGLRQEAKRIRIIAASSLIFLIIAGVAVWKTIDAYKSQMVAEQNEQEALSQKDRAVKAENTALVALESEKAARQLADSSRSVAIKERNSALEAYGLRRLAEIDLLPKRPINFERKLQLDQLLKSLDAIHTFPIIAKIRSHLQKIPSQEHCLLRLPAQNDRVGIKLSKSGDRLLIVNERSIEIWDAKTLRRLNSIEVRNLPERAAGGRIIWLKADTLRTRILFEVEYSFFADHRLAYETELIFMDTEEHPEFKFAGSTYKLIEGERELWSLDFHSTSPSFETTTRYPIVVNPYDDLYNEKELNYNNPFERNIFPMQPFAGKVGLKKDTVCPDHSDEVKAFVSKRGERNDSTEVLLETTDSIPTRYVGTRPGPFGQPSVLNVEVMLNGPECKYSLYTVVTSIPGMAIVGPIPMNVAPYAFCPNGEIVQLEGAAMFRMGEGYLTYKPVAVNAEKNLVLLRNKVLSLSTSKPLIQYRLNLAVSTISNVNFTDDGTCLIIRYKNNDISLMNIRDQSRHTFGAVNEATQIEISPDGQLVYLLSAEKEVQCWRMVGFGIDGWAPD